MGQRRSMATKEEVARDPLNDRARLGALLMLRPDQGSFETQTSHTRYPLCISRGPRRRNVFVLSIGEQ